MSLQLFTYVPVIEAYEFELKIILIFNYTCLGLSITMSLENRIGRALTAFTGPGKPVHLVHDDVGNRPQFANELEHGLQLGTVGSLGRLASIHELGHDDRAESVRSTLISFALCRDGVALGVEVGVGLSRRRDAEVADGELHAVREGLRRLR